jgi:hypothetical protein
MGRLRVGKYLIKGLAILALAGSLAACDVQTYDDAADAFRGDGDFSNGGETQINATSIGIGANPASAVFSLAGVALADDTYRITLSGAGANLIMDTDTNALDGELPGAWPSGSGTAGGNFITQFSFTTAIVLGPTLDQIRAIIFGSRCSSCHFGAGSTSGVPNMDLRNADAAFNALVDFSVFQDGNFTRVVPAQPANSYLVHKLQGVATVGGFMPPTGMLSAAEITAVEQWVTDGAVR